MKRPLLPRFSRYFYKVKNRIPQRIRRALYPVYYPLVDVYESAFGLRDELTPPKRKLYRWWNTAYKGVGRTYLRFSIHYAELAPDQRVLDVGCGIGRMAAAFTSYLDCQGEYHGFDIIPEGIQWCQENITPRYPNFHFQLADIYNSHYNPKGKLRGRDYVFPYQDGYFDFVILKSVFTHMLPQEVDHYLSEIARVLKSGGKTLITFFLLNRNARVYIRAGISSIDFKYPYDSCLVVDLDKPEFIIAYDEDVVREIFSSHGLMIGDSIHYGSWCGRRDFQSYQDFIIAHKLN